MDKKEQQFRKTKELISYQKKMGIEVLVRPYSYAEVIGSVTGFGEDIKNVYCKSVKWTGDIRWVITPRLDDNQSGYLFMNRETGLFDKSLDFMDLIANSFKSEQEAKELFYRFYCSVELGQKISIGGSSGKVVEIIGASIGIKLDEAPNGLPVFYNVLDIENAIRSQE